MKCRERQRAAIRSGGHAGLLHVLTDISRARASTSGTFRQTDDWRSRTTIDPKQAQLESLHRRLEDGRLRVIQ